MSYRTGYVPRKNKIQWKWVLLVFVVVLLSFSLLDFGLKYQRKEAVNLYGICGLNDNATRNLIDQEKNENMMLIQDYLFYGETLNFYAEPYVLDQKDEMAGKTVILKNLCTQEDYMFILEQTIDGQIPIEDLEPGVYLGYIMKNTQPYLLYMNEKVSDEFYTVTRYGKNHKVTIKADSSCFNNKEDEQDYLEQGYLFIEVEEQEAPDEVYDIVLDPGHFSYDAGNFLERGIQVKERTEAEETYRMAVALKEELEKLGLRVLVTRSSNTDIVNSYGLKGRLYKGYQAQAKYYIDIQMLSSSNASIRGTQVIYSSYSSNRFAATVYSSIIENTSLVSTETGRNLGILPSGRLDGFDGRMMIRESGGRILAAGNYSKKARDENGSFAAESRFGMQAIILEYGYMSNSTDMEIWDSELQEIAEATATGIARYLRIDK